VLVIIIQCFRADKIRKPGQDARNRQLAERPHARRSTAYPSRDFH
jgi:hypothetical protein